MSDDRRDSDDWKDGSRATGTGIGTPDVDTGDPETMGRTGGGDRRNSSPRGGDAGADADEGLGGSGRS
jgi:hypothetical protein